MLNIVIPMAGAGSRFAAAGFKDPKPLIPLRGFPMIQLVIRNLQPQCDHRFTFICQRSHVEHYGLQAKLREWAPDCNVILIEGITEGAACTVLAATNIINTKDPLMIANSDQYVDADINHYLDSMDQRDLDGLIMTMTANDPKWSFVQADADGKLTRVVEKEVISSEATVGIYNFRHGSDFVRAAQQMILADERVNGEFYVAPVYNNLIKNDKSIGFFNIGQENSGMYGLGIPVDLEKFLSHSVADKAMALLK